MTKYWPHVQLPRRSAILEMSQSLKLIKHSLFPSVDIHMQYKYNIFTILLQICVLW